MNQVGFDRADCSDCKRHFEGDRPPHRLKSTDPRIQRTLHAQRDRTTTGCVLILCRWEICVAAGSPTITREIAISSINGFVTRTTGKECRRAWVHLFYFYKLRRARHSTRSGLDNAHVHQSTLPVCQHTSRGFRPRSISTTRAEALSMRVARTSPSRRTLPPSRLN